MFSYVATCDFLFPSGHRFIQTMAARAVSVCFVMVVCEDQLIPGVEGGLSLGDLPFSHSSSVALEWSGFSCWGEAYLQFWCVR